mmetsp:Transcript_144481/g.360136  ORF Transcript_144481/g.360136 Transcript_144481/m.360136 type:complete len:251 (+) Transcript_144481:158-910(+)
MAGLGGHAASGPLCRPVHGVPDADEDSQRGSRTLEPTQGLPWHRPRRAFHAVAARRGRRGALQRALGHVLSHEGPLTVGGDDAADEGLADLPLACHLGHPREGLWAGWRHFQCPEGLGGDGRAAPAGQRGDLRLHDRRLRQVRSCAESRGHLPGHEEEKKTPQHHPVHDPHQGLRYGKGCEKCPRALQGDAHRRRSVQYDHLQLDHRCLHQVLRSRDCRGPAPGDDVSRNESRAGPHHLLHGAEGILPRR